MKKTLIALMALVLAGSLLSCAKKTGNAPSEGSSSAVKADSSKKSYKIAMITDSGDITDESFNQTTYEAGKAFCEANNISYKYYKPAADSDADRIASAEQAIAEGANIILCPGYLMAAMVVEISQTYPDVKLIALDVSEFDYTSAGGKVGTPNVFCAIYQEEIPGYLAGYAAVKMGYKHLGFLGGMAVPAVVRYGYGFVQGVDSAAKELGIAKDVKVEYVYGNQFYGDPDITAYMDTWVQQKNVKVIFPCGGGIWTSAAEAAKKFAGVKLIGVDVDQKAIIDAYAEDMTITSAMKGLSATVKAVLTDTIINDNWNKYAGKIENLGLVSDDPDDNFVALAPSTVYTDSFTENDYRMLIKDMLEGKIKVSNDTTSEPVTAVSVKYYGNIK